MRKTLSAITTVRLLGCVAAVLLVPVLPSAVRGAEQEPGAGGGLTLSASRQRGNNRQPRAGRTSDVGDSYSFQGRPVRLHRSLDQVAVRFRPDLSSAVRDQRLRSALPQADIESSKGAPGRRVSIVRIRGAASAARGVSTLAAAAEAKNALGALRQSPDVVSAFPVLLNPETGNRLLLTDAIVARLRPGVAPSAVTEDRSLVVVERLWGTTDEYVFRLQDPKGQDPLAVANALAESSLVVWAEPNFVQEYEKSAEPNDTLFSNQWHLQNTGQGGGTTGADVDAPQAWDLTTGSSAITIAIIDDGVEKTHEDLSANIFVNAGEVAGNGVDDDGNGYIDDVSGWDFNNNDNDASPMSAEDNHGTAVAGVAAGRGNNGLGVSGGCQNCRILPVKIFSPDFAGDTAVANAIRYAASLADVLNNSWGGGSPSSAILSAIQWAVANGRGGKGSVPLFATGNSAGNYLQMTLSGFPAGTFTFRWRYSKDAALSDGEDTAWLGWVEFPGGERVGFDSGMPSGWTSGGSANWTISSDRSRADEGRCHVQSAKAGTITHSQETHLDVVKTVTAGDLRWGVWASSEEASDVLEVLVYHGGSWLGPYLAASGVPSITTDVGYPARYDDAVAIGATSDFDCRSSYSQYGPSLDLVAPSNGGSSSITTTDRTGSDGYEIGNYTSGFGGTSSATPLTSGVVGLMLSYNPDLTVAQVRQILQDTADKVGPDAYVGGRNDRYGYGRINAYAAVTAATPCSYSIDPTSAGYAAAGGTGSVTVTAGAGCAWTAVSNDAWITVTGGASGTGNDTVDYSVDANVGAAREGTITIAGETFTVSQAAAACSYTIDPTSVSPTAAGGTGSVAVTTGGWCSWTAVSNDAWITVTGGASGTGSGTVDYSVDANAGAARDGTVTIAGETFTVAQAAAPPPTISINDVSVAEGD